MKIIEINNTIKYSNELGSLLETKFIKIKNLDFYKQYIRNKNIIKKRKLLSLLLYAGTSLEIEDIIKLTVDDFNIIISQFDLYKDCQQHFLKIKFKFDSFCNYLILNLKFCYFFTVTELYTDFRKTKSLDQPMISSIIETEKPLKKNNLEKDLNEQIVEILSIEELRS
uniref:hypothetical protein n=1 Tax=Ulva meridionalis TaxID=434723 RepID=UPI0028E0A1A7|nr:hypothetical protein NQY40_pgp028 [Ulva meridionalis]WFS80083.1 hypothetical protein [Ulva meridionalis]